MVGPVAAECVPVLVPVVVLAAEALALEVAEAAPAQAGCVPLAEVWYFWWYKSKCLE